MQPVIKWTGSKRSQAKEILKHLSTNDYILSEPVEDGDRLLFLDIDGVLNNDKQLNISDALDDTLIELLNQLTEVKIVIVSSWGYCNETLNILRKHGLKLKIIGGFSPFVHGNRGQHLNNWLVKYCMNKDIKYAILDDVDNYTKKQRKFLVKTNFNTGLTQQNIDSVEKCYGL